MTPLGRAHTALALLAIDPDLGGLHLRARPCPARDAVLRAAETLPLARIRLHPAMSAEALDGGIDVSATLAAGTVTQTRGLLTMPSTLVLGMAERADPFVAARLAATLDTRAGHVLIAVDEGVEDEYLTPVLSDRLAFYCDVSGIALSDLGEPPAPSDPIALKSVTAPEDLPDTLVDLAVRLGIVSLRAVGFALRTARAHAALNRRKRVTDADIAMAAALVFAHRATQIPADETPAQDTADESPPDSPNTDEQITLPDELLLDAVKAALPADLLAHLGQANAHRGATGTGAGQRRVGNRRGRPLPARQNGASSARVDLIATLRAAVPWQSLRRAQSPDREGAIIRHGDLRRKRYQEQSDRLLIFAVDASGSAAMARMGEAKGAIELLLAEAYARRDHVALIAFRGEGAEVLLEPTRSLVRTKRKLASLPGGGATPLAAGLMQAHAMALQARRKGLTPTVITLTDGRANMALDGQPSRPRAAEDAVNAATALSAAGIDTMMIDTGRRPERSLAQLAARMGGRYLALPRADARSLSNAVTRALDD